MPNLKNTLKSFQAPIFSLIILMVSNGFFITYQSLRLEIAGSTSTEIGLVHSFFYFGLLIGATKIEPLIVRIGHIRTYATFASIFTASILLQSVYISPFYWMGLRFFAGISLAGLYITIESWLLANCPSATRGKVLSIYMIALYATQALSQFIVNFIDLESFTPYIIAATFCVLSSIPLTMTYTNPPCLTEPSHHSMKKILFASPFGFIGCFVSGLIVSSIYSLEPAFALDKGLPVALLISITITGGFLMQWPIGHLSDIFDRATTLLTISFLSIFPPIIIAIWFSSEWILFACSFVLGAFSFVLYPISISHVCDRIQPKDVTQATSVLLISYGLGAVLGPLISSFFMDNFTSVALFYSLSGASILLTIVGTISNYYKKSIPAEDQSDYITLPRTTIVACELDPRAHSEEEEKEKPMEKI